MRETGARSLGRTRTTDNAEIGTGPVGGAPRAGFARPMGYDPGRGLCVALQLIRESPSLVPIMPPMRPGTFLLFGNGASAVFHLLFRLMSLNALVSQPMAAFRPCPLPFYVRRLSH